MSTLELNLFTAHKKAHLHFKIRALFIKMNNIRFQEKS